ncbi:MAG: hypothetical protein WCA20_01025 [Candidatus Sulfotelmatobacter sp.]
MTTPICANEAADIDSTTRANKNAGNNADNNVHVVPLAHHPPLARCCCYARGLRGDGLRGLRGEIFDFDLLL